MQSWRRADEEWGIAPGWELNVVLCYPGSRPWNRVLLANFLVTTTSDAAVVPPTPEVPHPFSLRQAIEAANSTPGPDTISFDFPPVDIPGVIEYDPVFEVWHIEVDRRLPAITDALSIDGYSQKSITGSLGVDAVQTLTLGGVVTGGTFTLTFDGQTTTPLPFDATADEVSSALQALPKIGANNVAVSADSSGDGVNAGVLTITFVNGLTDTTIRPITGDASGLTGAAPR